VVEHVRLLMTVNEMSNMGSVQAAAIGESRPTALSRKSSRNKSQNKRNKQRPCPHAHPRAADGNARGPDTYAALNAIELVTPNMNVHMSTRCRPRRGTGDVLRVVALATSHGIVIHKETSGRKDQATSSRETTKGCPYGGTGIPGSNRPS